MLVIPCSTPGDGVLRVLVTDDPATATGPACTPACTPALAAHLHERWAGATYADRDGHRELVLPVGGEAA